VHQISSPKDSPKKMEFEIYQLTSIVVRINFTTAHFDTLPWAEKLFISHEIFVTRWSLCWWYVCQISSSKDLPTKRYLKSTNMCSCEFFSNNYTSSQISNSFLWVNLLDLKFGAHIINIEVISWKKFHGQFFFSIFGRVSNFCVLYTSPSPRDRTRGRMPSCAW